MDSIQEKVKEVKLNALEIINKKLVEDISLCDLINLCVCLNNNFKDDDILAQAMKLLLSQSTKNCACEKDVENEQSDEPLK